MGVSEAKSWFYLLTNREKKAVRYVKKLYIKRYGKDPKANRNLVAFLGDNPRKFLCWSAPSNKIPTLRMNRGKMHILSRERWPLKKNGNILSCFTQFFFLLLISSKVVHNQEPHQRFKLQDIRDDS